MMDASTYPSLPCCISHVHGNIDSFNDASDRVNGDKKGSIRLEECVVYP